MPLFDDLARILASPLPRRQALKLFSGALAAGVLGAVGVRRAAAQDALCPPAHVCGTNCCLLTEHCCKPATRKPYCIKNTQICCGNTACGPHEVCCKTVCCAPGQTCVNGRCSSSNTNVPAR